MKYKAVIFDLFGTLIDVFPLASWRAAQQDIASTLGLEEAAFLASWRSSSAKRNRGAFPTIEANLEHVLNELGMHIDYELVAAAAMKRTAWSRECLAPRSDAISTLRYVRDQGLKIGLISNCAPDIPILWPETAFAPLVDAPLFLCSEGLQKPNARIFELSCERLCSNASSCLYVADGQGGELAAATKIGMDVVQIPSVYEHTEEPFYDNPENWQAAKISRLEEIKGFIGEAEVGA